MMKDIAVAALTAIVASAVYCKISAAYTFKVIDGYVKEMIDMAKDSIRNAHLDKGST